MGSSWKRDGNLPSPVGFGTYTLQICICAHLNTLTTKFESYTRLHYTDWQHISPNDDVAHAWHERYRRLHDEQMTMSQCISTDYRMFTLQFRRCQPLIQILRQAPIKRFFQFGFPLRYFQTVQCLCLRCVRDSFHAVKVKWNVFGYEYTPFKLDKSFFLRFCFTCFFYIKYDRPSEATMMT